MTEMEENMKAKLEEAKERTEKRRKSLKTHIAVPIIIIIAISLIIVGAAGSYLCYQSTITSLKTSMTAAVSIAQAAVSGKISDLSGTVSTLAAQRSVWDSVVSVDSKSSFITQEAATYGFLNGYIVSANGNCQDGTNYSSSEFFKAGMSGKTFLSAPFVDKATNKLVLTLSAPIFENGEKNSSVTGVLCFTIPQSIINGIVEEIHVGSNGTAYMIDKDGNSIANVDTKRVIEKNNIGVLAATDSSLKPMAVLHEKAISGETGFGQYTYGGVNKFLAFSPISGSDGWSICINAPISEFTSGVTNTVYVTALFLLIFLVIGLLISVNLAKTLSMPVNIFVERLSKLADGDVTSPLADFKTTTAEFQSLSQSLQKTLNNTQAVITDIDYLLSEIADGNLNLFSRATDNYIGDYRHILTSFRHLKRSLTESFGNIIEVSEQVSAGSNQVSSGAQSLAQGATEQASSIQELSASIADISRHIKANASDAEKAKDLSSSTEEIMQSSVQNMALAREAMDEIEETSKNISKVIKAIDDIAFQTNILALNAAVEAARAGNAGKGFAVVADEVRSLSQKSAEAAKNTTALIESSIEAVGKGSALVSRTSDSFEVVSAKSSEVVKLIDSISIQAQEQSTAVSQISIGIEQVSSVVQMNSATSEESAAASEQLSGQAAVLKELTGHFTLATSFAAED